MSCRDTSYDSPHYGARRRRTTQKQNRIPDNSDGQHSRHAVDAPLDLRTERRSGLFTVTRNRARLCAKAKQNIAMLCPRTGRARIAAGEALGPGRRGML